MLEDVRHSARINHWNAIIIITRGESNLDEEIIGVEKSNNNDTFKITYFTYIKIDNRENPFDAHRYKKNELLIKTKDKRYNVINQIEKMTIPIHSWSNLLALDGDTYKIEISSFDTTTTIEFSELSFESGTGLTPIKFWINDIRSFNK